jgi:hypothetical protein
MATPDRVSYPAVSSTAITGTAQTGLAGRGVYITGTGNIIGQLVGDAADRTFSGLVVGSCLPLAFGSITSATATGFILS